MKVGPSERGGKGGRAKKMVVFFDTSNLFQSGGSDCTHHITTHLLGCSDLPTALEDLYKDWRLKKLTILISIFLLIKCLIFNQIFSGILPLHIFVENL